MCEARDEVAGQAIPCRDYGEWDRIPAPKAPPEPATATPAPRAPASPSPARPARRQPWYYDFAEGYGYISLALGALVGVVLLIIPAVAGAKDGAAGCLVAAGGVGAFLSGCFTCGLLVVLVDIARSLRVLRRKMAKGGGDG